jgi:hypothetical protein
MQFRAFSTKSACLYPLHVVAIDLNEAFVHEAAQVPFSRAYITPAPDVRHTLKCPLDWASVRLSFFPTI